MFLALMGSTFAETEIVHEKGQVSGVESKMVEAPEGGIVTPAGIIEGMYKQQTIEVELLSGDNEGETVEVINDVTGNPFDISVEEGDKVFLYAQDFGSGEMQYFIQDYWHSDGLLIWTLVFLAAVVVIGGKAGLKAIVSLGSSVALVFLVLLPALKNGMSPVPLTVGISAVIILVTHLIITGVGKKSWIAMLGTLGGVLAAVLLVYLVSASSGLTGLGTEDGRILAVNSPGLNFQGLLFSGIIIGALGAVMDIGISIASGLHEVKMHKPSVKRAELIKSGMNIGKDIMGSMLNTLIFAYIGSAMMSMVLFYHLQTDVLELVNQGFIAEEIVRSLVGSLGLLVTIPLTAVLAGYLFGKKS